DGSSAALTEVSGVENFHPQLLSLAALTFHSPCETHLSLSPSGPLMATVGFATVGRAVRTPSLNQPQMTLPHHQPLQDLELISSAALLQAHVAAQAQAQNNAAQSAGGSGSVVYENSYNSFQR
ncbi:unnamed protein product, partial [Hydatigera taeniaeformis]|uniref:MBNL1 n=1 Tax=Hydatigena taeniaeformis TaxID=6205 RepID=A0A0R3WYC0_HYDTA